MSFSVQLAFGKATGQHLSTFTLCLPFDVVILFQKYNLQRYFLVHRDEQMMVFITINETLKTFPSLGKKA